MVQLSTFLEEVNARQQTFDSTIAACVCRQDYVSAMAYYADLLTSCHGEKWDQKAHLFELDNIFENLRKAGCVFQGQPISDRRTDKDDPNIIKYVATVPNKKTIKHADGTKTTSVNGTKQSTKTKHVHKETMDIYKMPKTNIYGIPAAVLNGEYFKGKGKPYVTAHGYKATNANSSLILRRVNKSDKEMFEKALGAERANLFFNEIDVREQYGLANIAVISINRAGDCALTTGLIRTDYDTIDGVPYVTSIVLAFLTAPLIKASMTNTSIVKATLTFVSKRLAEQGIAVHPQCAQRVFVPGGMQKFLQTLSEASANMDRHINSYEKEQARRQACIRAAEEYEREQEMKQAQEREERRQRLAEERAEARRLKAERDAQNKEEKAARKADKHNKAVQSTIQQIVTDLLSHGVTPTKEVYQNLLNNIRAHETGKDSEIVCEALTLLISVDTSQADEEIAQLVNETAIAEA